MSLKANNYLASSCSIGEDESGKAFNRHELNEAKHSLPTRYEEDEEVRSQPADPEKYRRLIEELYEYIRLSPGEQSEHRIAGWEKRERESALKGREPDLSDTFDAVARHAERRVRQSKMLDEAKDHLTQRIFALEEEVCGRHDCWCRPTAQALADLRRRLQYLMSKSFKRYKVI